MQDALLSRSPGDDTKQSSLQETPQELYSNSGSEALRLLFVQDVIEPVTRAAQAVAQARYVVWHVTYFGGVSMWVSEPPAGFGEGKTGI